MRLSQTTNRSVPTWSDAPTRRPRTQPLFRWSHGILLGLAATFWSGASLSAGDAVVDPATYESEARAVTQKLAKTLGESLTREMASAGPGSAIKTCTEVAPATTGQISRETGWRVTRVGTRVRDPLLGTPDAWEQAVLTRLAIRRARGEAFETLNFGEVVTEPIGKYYRYIQAIGVQPACVACHGPTDQLDPAVLTLLQSTYPHDRATGYKVGDLRGAVSIKRPIP